MTKQQIDKLWNTATRESIENGEIFACYRFATLVADAEAKRIHEEGMVTVGHMREQIAKERERAALMTEHLGMIGYGTLAIAAAIRKGDQE